MYKIKRDQHYMKCYTLYNKGQIEINQLLWRQGELLTSTKHMTEPRGKCVVEYRDFTREIQTHRNVTKGQKVIVSYDGFRS